MERKIDGETDRWRDRYMEGKIDGETDGLTDRYRLQTKKLTGRIDR